MAANTSSTTRTLASASILGSFPSRIDRDAGSLPSTVSSEHSCCRRHEVNPLPGPGPPAGHWRPWQSGEVVDALVVAVGAVGGQGGVVLVSCPLVEQMALAGVVIARHRIAAGVGDPLDLDHDNGAGATAGREPGRDLLPPVVSGAPPAGPARTAAGSAAGRRRRRT